MRITTYVSPDVRSGGAREEYPEENIRCQGKLCRRGWVSEESQSIVAGQTHQ
jgi:hypothetical protein